MALGVMHDLAVGVDPNGADAWALQDVLALGVTVGAPPDEYNQLGQDWSQPPWRPDRLVELGYAPFRALVNAVLRHAGGVRIDHIIGLFRLWWIPQGRQTDRRHLRPLRPRGDDRHRRAGGAARRRGRRRRGPRHRRTVGARLPARARPARHVDPVVRAGPVARRRPAAGAAVAGVLPVVGHHARPAADRGLPGRRARADSPGARPADPTRPRRNSPPTAPSRPAGSPNCGGSGCSPRSRSPTVDEIVRALYEYLGRTPSRLLALALPDAVGDVRAQNQPGTTDEYPNWRVPLADPDGRRTAARGRLHRPACRRARRGHAAGGNDRHASDRISREGLICDMFATHRDTRRSREEACSAGRRRHRRGLGRPAPARPLPMSDPASAARSTWSASRTARRLPILKSQGVKAYVRRLVRQRRAAVGVHRRPAEGHPQRQDDPDAQLHHQGRPGRDRQYTGGGRRAGAPGAAPGAAPAPGTPGQGTYGGPIGVPVPVG